MISITHEVTIEIGGRAAHSAVFTHSVEAVCIETTAKAVKLRDNAGRFAWFPRKALSAVVRKPIPGVPAIDESGLPPRHTVTLARWFRPDRWQTRMIDNGRIGGVSAA